MSELVYTQCDGGCNTIINVLPEIAMQHHAWAEDEFGSHFCPVCQTNAALFEAETASPEEVQALAEGVTEATQEKVKAAKKVATSVRKAKGP